MIRAARVLMPFLVCNPLILSAQEEGLPVSPTDPEYISDYTSQLTLRAFASRKINGYQVGQWGETHEAEFSPNDVTSLGIGFTYGFLGVNLNFKLPALNNDDDRYGSTRSLDLASYIYFRRFTADIFAQVYKGHYLSDNDLLTSRLSAQPWLIRPDLKTRSYGLNSNYVFNHRRFSYRASFVQSEWQRRSAGSFLAGINLHYFGAEADSVIVPRQAADPVGNETEDRLLFRKSSVYSGGINGGYAHTFVHREHWFFTAALLAGVGISNTRLVNEELDYDRSAAGLHLNGTLRAGLGYNSEKWFAGIYYINFLTRNYAPLPGQTIWQQAANGLYRLVVARRIDISRK